MSHWSGARESLNAKVSALYLGWTDLDLGHLALISCLYRFGAMQDEFRPSQAALL